MDFMEEIIKMEMLLKFWVKCLEDDGVFKVGMFDSNENGKK